MQGLSTGALAFALGIASTAVCAADAADTAETPDTQSPQSKSPQHKSRPSIYRKDNLVAWCIVPFDAKKRGPEARAAMLERLGIKKVAYDWRAQHVKEFEQEILAYKKHGLEYFAFWGWHDDMGPLIAKYQIKPQIWQTCPSPKGATQEERINAAVKQLLPMVERTKKLGLKLGLYNHGGWGGEPANLAAVCEHLRKNGAGHVGIVYNFHHGHGHIDSFAKLLAIMKPYLHCLNLNGMNDGAKPKILQLGDGKHEKHMMDLVRKSGYTGPIGILDHRSSEDTEKVLRGNLAGIKKLLEQLGDKDALRTYKN